MKNLFFTLMLSFISVTSFAENSANPSEISDFRSCTVSITYESENMFGQTVEVTETHYLGEVDDNGFGNLDCISRARRFVNLNA